MITKIIAKNFLSWKDLTFEIKSGISLINGWNDDDQTPEGSGKSAILNSISWGIYGKLPKDVKIDEVVSRGAKSCIVEVVFDKYSIVRSRGPNRLFIKEDGKKLLGKDAKETQKIIESKIGLSFEAFCQTIYFAQNYPKKFITANQEDKAKILSEIQDLTVFDEARAKVKLDSTDLVSEIQNLRTKHLSITNNIQSINHEIALTEQKIDSFEEKKQIELKHLNKNIEYKKQELSDSLVGVKAHEAHILQLEASLKDVDLNKLRENNVSIKADIAQLNNKLNLLKNPENRKKDIQFEITKQNQNQKQIEKKIAELTNFIENPIDACTTCGTVLGDKDTTQANIQLTKLSDDLNELDKYVNSLQLELNNMSDNTLEIVELEDTIKSIQKVESDWVNKLQVVESTIDELKNNVINYELMLKNNEKISIEITAIEKDINTINSEKVGVDLYEIIKTKEKELEDILLIEKSNEVSISKIVEKQHQLDQLYKGFKDIKTFIFNSLLNDLTIKSNTYLQNLFEVPVNLQFVNDNKKIKTIFKYDGQERSLGLLSGGQFRRASLAIDLALSDIVSLRTGATLNIRIFDEYMKDLSEESMRKCLKLLEKLKGPTILIEHNSMFKSIVDQTHEVLLKNGVSQLNG